MEIYDCFTEITGKFTIYIATTMSGMIIIYIAAYVAAKYERPAVTMSNKSAVSSNATETTGQKYKKFNARSSCREYAIETETSPKVKHIITKPPSSTRNGKLKCSNQHN